MLINIPILESIKEYQTQHGLKYENYQRYRSYCSRRIHRLRRSLNVHQGIASSAKARHHRGRKLMDISNSMVLEAGEKNQEYAERMLLIPLCLAERAWSYAMQLKQETSEHPRRRYHLIRRLEKASINAERFEKLCHDPESPCSERTKLEATAYAAYITGSFKLEREIWDEAKEKLGIALSIYFRLSVAIRKEDVLEHYRQRIDELRASLRYCNFNLPSEQESKRQSKVELPPVLQFHDLAFKHVRALEQEAAHTPKKPVELKPEPEAHSRKGEEEKMPPEEEEDEFEETQEDMEGDSEGQEGEDEDDDDDQKQGSAPRAGGVTGLVKNWLGGAWS